MFRQTLERLARKRVLRRYLPAAYGRIPFCASPDAQLKYIRPGAQAFDKDLLRIASEYLKPGINVWDIGANVVGAVMVTVIFYKTCRHVGHVDKFLSE